MFIEKITAFLGKLGIFFDDAQGKNNDVIRNQELVKEVEKVFKQVLERDSVDAEMLYDCSFMIAVPTEHYNRTLLHAGRTAQAIVKRFYAVIEANRSKRPNYRPQSKYWDFQFVPKEADIENAGIEVISQPVAEKSWEDTLSDKSSMGRVSINGKHSKYSRWDIDSLVLENIHILGEGRIRIPFDENLGNASPSTPQPQQGAQKPFAGQSHSEANPVAELYFDENGVKKGFPMRQAVVEVGRATSDADRATFGKLFIQTQDTSLRREHFLIRYEQKENRFYIATFAPAVVNGEALKVSPLKDNPTWIALKQNSRIECGLYKIDFKALK